MPRRSDWRLCAGAHAVSNRVPPTFDPREEPGALAAHAGICAGGRGVILVPTATMDTWPSMPPASLGHRTGSESELTVTARGRLPRLQRNDAIPRSTSHVVQPLPGHARCNRDVAGCCRADTPLASLSNASGRRPTTEQHGRLVTPSG